MAIYINTNTNVWPYYQVDLANDYHAWNVYQPLPDGIYEIVEQPKPSSADPFYDWREVFPELTNGVWTQKFELFETNYRLPFPDGPGPWEWDQEDKVWYLNSPLAKDTHE